MAFFSKIGTYFSDTFTKMFKKTSATSDELGNVLKPSSKFLSNEDVLKNIMKNIPENQQKKFIEFYYAQKQINENAIKELSEETGQSVDDIKNILNNATPEDYKSAVEIVEQKKSVIDQLRAAKPVKNVYMIMKIVGGVGTVSTLIGFWLSMANKETERINNTNFTVINIQKNGLNSALLKYSPAQKLCIYNNIKNITNTIPSTPSIENQTFNITKIIDIDEIEFEYNNPLPQPITSGNLKFEAKAQDQLQCSINDLKNSLQNTFNALPYVLIGAVLIIFIIFITKFKQK